MIRKPTALPNENLHFAASIHHINAHKMSTTTTTLKSPTATLATSLNNKGYSGGCSLIKAGTATAAATLSSLAANLCKAAKTNQSTPPMGAAVVVNSLIYSKPSFCSIVVDIGGNDSSASNNNNIDGFDKNKALLSPPLLTTGNKGFFSPPATDKQSDAHVYMMSTTMNGAIHHQISEICDNLIAMGLGFGMEENSDHDTESLVEFCCDDTDDDGDDIEFLHTDEDYRGSEGYKDEDDQNANEEDDYDTDDDDDDDDNDNIGQYETDEDDACLCNYGYGEDVTDFSRCPPMITRDFPLYSCETKKKKKVRFNPQPTVHVLRTWDFAYRSARKGEWEMYARDRERFRLRIQRVAPMLNTILDQEHRQKVYEQRFSSVCAEREDSAAPEETAPPPKQTTSNQKQTHHKKKKKRRRRRPNF